MKKFLAIIMVVAMMASFATVAFADDVTLPSDGLVANYSFDAADDSLTVVGAADGITYADGKATFNGTAGLASNLDFGGFDAISVVVTFTLNADITTTNWPFVLDDTDTTSWDEHNFLGLNLNNNEFKSYFSPTQNRWCNGCWTGYEEADIGDTLKAGKTHTVVVTIGNQTDGTQSDNSTATGLFHSLYLDGTQVQSWCVHNGEDFNITLKDVLGDHARLFIGMSNILNDGLYTEFINNISMDNLAVYNRALTADEAKACTAAPTTAPTPGVTLPKLAALSIPTPPAGDGGDGGDGGSGSGDAPTPGAPATGFATVAIALVAVGSGAYVVSKKRH